MSETKFTNEEWFIQDFQGKGSCIDIDSKKGNICQVYSLVETNYKTLHNDELKANAALISAAPDMFNALLDLYEDKEVWQDLYASQQEFIVNVLNKATGSSFFKH